MEVTTADRLSPLYQKVLTHCRGRISTLREKNDAHNLDATQTALVRGGITELKQLVTLLGPVAE